MPLIVWSEEMSVGVKQLDEQHLKLVEIVNELNDAIVAGQGREKLGAIIERLIQYTREHLKYEEDLLNRSGYPEAADHGAQHDSMISVALSAQAKFRWGTKPELAEEVQTFLQRWLTHHIQGEDKLYTEHLHSKGIY